MTRRHVQARAGRYSRRDHRLATEGADLDRPRAPRHAAIPTRDTATITVGSEDVCLRCEEAIVLTLTGWEHA